MTKTKGLLSSKVCYPTMDRMVENIISACNECAINTSNTHPEPLQMSALPKGLWVNISLQFCCPLPSRDYLVLIVDEFSRFPVVETTRSLAAEKLTKINKLSTPFSSKPYTVNTKKGNMLTAYDDDKSHVTRNVIFCKKVNMYNCRVGHPIPITPMHEIPEVSEPILPRRSERTKHPSILLRDYVCE